MRIPYQLSQKNEDNFYNFLNESGILSRAHMSKDWADSKPCRCVLMRRGSQCRANI